MAVIVDKAKCIGCGACTVECPFEALELVDGIAVVDAEKCKDCTKCTKVCPADALSMPERADKPKAKASAEPVAEKKAVKPSQAADGEVWSGVWVLVEYINENVSTVSWELLGEGRKLADALGCDLCAVVTGYQVDHVIDEAFAYGAEKAYVLDNPVLKDYRSDPYADAITELVRKYKPEIILCGATSMGRDVFPSIATKMQTGLTADCTVLEIDPETRLLKMTRPAFGGNIMATIQCRTHRPQMSTVRPRVMAMPERIEGRKGQIIREELTLNEANYRTKVVEFIPSTAKSAFLDKAEIIVAVGLGIGSQKNMAIAEELADAIGGTIAGTRGAVEAGWISHDQQVGQTGVTVRPKIYIALGISGAIQHLVGMQTSDYIIAVNNDPEAAIFNVANYGIVGDILQVVPALTAELKMRLGAAK
ncbi:FAD-binding protein [Desulfitobacterium sp.]|uniref:FAD-binding protein n=1 Tax=Desulfitobacterium sp. TaxID=49981 RepID=UPI002B1F0F56|nr:FAD-binding protein [Desulfitobacterium sp.]MEA4900526.1 FAD-binding protein [Desulfitobacterium sp.]